MRFIAWKLIMDAFTKPFICVMWIIVGFGRYSQEWWTNEIFSAFYRKLCSKSFAWDRFILSPDFKDWYIYLIIQIISNTKIDFPLGSGLVNFNQVWLKFNIDNIRSVWFPFLLFRYDCLVLVLYHSKRFGGCSIALRIISI